jgi:DNA-directed RNA polymerase specialized sigma24 family protein
VLQDIYLTVWRKAASFDEGVASPITWLVAIARNRSIDRLRSQASAHANVPIEAAADVPDASLLAIERLEIGEDRASSETASRSSRSVSLWRSARRFSTGLRMRSWPRRPACRSAP